MKSDALANVSWREVVGRTGGYGLFANDQMLLFLLIASFDFKYWVWYLCLFFCLKKAFNGHTSLITSNYVLKQWLGLSICVEMCLYPPTDKFSDGQRRQAHSFLCKPINGHTCGSEDANFFSHNTGKYFSIAAQSSGVSKAFQKVLQIWESCPLSLFRKEGLWLTGRL